MDEPQRLINAYRSRASASARSRLNLLMALEGFPDRRVVSFLLNVLDDRGEVEEVRGYVLQQLRCRRELISPADQLSVAMAFRDVLADRTIPSLRLQAALALGDLTDISGVLSWLNAVCLARDESIDLRYAAFTSLERAGPTPECIELLHQMAGDETLGLSARSVLSAWHIE